MYFYYFTRYKGMRNVILKEEEPYNVVDRGSGNDDGGSRLYYFSANSYHDEIHLYESSLDMVTSDWSGNVFYITKSQNDKKAIKAFQKYYKNELKMLKRSQKETKKWLKLTKKDVKFFENVRFFK